MRPVPTPTVCAIKLYHTTQEHVNSNGNTKRAERCRSALGVQCSELLVHREDDTVLDKDRGRADLMEQIVPDLDFDCPFKGTLNVDGAELEFGHFGLLGLEIHDHLLLLCLLVLQLRLDEIVVLATNAATKDKLRQ